jgi:hypothetical protein
MIPILSGFITTVALEALSSSTVMPNLVPLSLLARPDTSGPVFGNFRPHGAL